VHYASELWWQFSPSGDASRTLRASLAALATACGFGLWKLMRPVPAPESLSLDSALAACRRILADSTDSSANAALLGDKRFLFDSEHEAFLMYQVSRRSWVTLGDPVGPAAKHEQLCWRFRELCDRHDSWPVYFQVSEESLALYVDMGLSLSQLGEDARVRLEHFSMSGAPRSRLRGSRNRLLKAGASCEVVPRGHLAPFIPALRRVSDAWLASKGISERSFSLGAFSADYLSNFDCAVVRIGQEIVAFANLWQAPAAREISVDLLRYDGRAPSGIVDYVLTELMMWAGTHGFEWFDLGVAPLPGLEDHPLATVWRQIGNLPFRHGEEFRGFAELRRYKSQFDPVWRPRYLACPGGLALPRILLDAAALISGSSRPLLQRRGAA
jgi:phosphatidylglycerol lysyltransferase